MRQETDKENENEGLYIQVCNPQSNEPRLTLMKNTQVS